MTSRFETNIEAAMGHIRRLWRLYLDLEHAQATDRQRSTASPAEQSSETRTTEEARETS